MPLQKLTFRPGLNRDQTNYTNEGGWYECDKVRFRSGMPQKLGGWLRYGLFTIVGACYEMFNWITSYSDDMMAMGTNRKVYIEVGQNIYDITPLSGTFTSTDTDNCIDVTNGSTTVNINIVANGTEVGTYVTLSGVAGPIGGIPASDFNKEHVVTAVIDDDNFRIVVATAATSTVSNAGGTAITAAIQIPPGFAYSTYGYGWGTSTWGRGGWGSGSTQPVNLPQRDWWFDNFDNDLVMNIRNGAVYYWERGTLPSPGTALGVRAALLSSFAGATDVPTEVMQIMVSQGDRHLLAFGATPYGGGDFDPLLIRWASQDDPFDWTPEVTNTAGFIRVSRGSRIVRAVPTRQETVVFTDSNIYSLQFLGTTDVFSLQELSDNISIAGSRAVTAVNNVVYWMGTDKFFAYSGRVETLPCSLRNHVFNNLNFNQLDQIICGTNEGWHEIWWYYPTANSNTNDAYVVYNYLEKVWYYGTIERSAWDDSPLRKFPQAIKTTYINDIDATGVVYNHEQGTNDDTLPMTAFITSSDFDITDGEQFMLMYRLIPDIDFAGSTAAAPEATMIIKPHNFPGAAYNANETGRVIQTTVNQYTNQLYIRARARQMGFGVESTGLDTQWQLGSPRLDARPDGKR
jgi:hypothetical protein